MIIFSTIIKSEVITNDSWKKKRIIGSREKDSIFKLKMKSSKLVNKKIKLRMLFSIKLLNFIFFEK